jgi:pimeloyl-ACP methyl ester carboxylesterase
MDDMLSTPAQGTSHELHTDITTVRGEFLDIDGARLYYYAAGTRGGGEPMVLIHGFPTSSHLWQELVPLLPEGRRVVVVDLLGYGRSDPPGDRGLGIKAHADRLLIMLDLLGINRACLIGHDIGGGIAQAMAVRAPHRVSHLCLISSVAFDDWPSREVKMARATLPLTRHLPATWLLGVLKTDLARGYVDHDLAQHAVERYAKSFATPAGRDLLVAHLEALDSADTVEIGARLGSVPAPTAIIHGAHDPFLSLATARRLQQAIRGATLDVFESARHFLPEESPDRIAEIITALVEK